MAVVRNEFHAVTIENSPSDRDEQRMTYLILYLDEHKLQAPLGRKK